VFHLPRGASQATDRTRLPMSRFQPSIITKKRSFAGSERTVGGSIIMPIDIVSVAVIMSRGAEIDG
jgi:hypothetical protein